jgi:GTP pyrophosphokinase
VLTNGDQVEILTSEKQHPKEEWLNSVVTGKAIARIRNYLREHKRIAADEGKEILKKRFSKEKITFNDDNVQKALTYLNQLEAARDLVGINQFMNSDNNVFELENIIKNSGDEQEIAYAKEILKKFAKYK